MEKVPTTKKQQLKELNTKLKKLQSDLVIAKKVSGIDEYIEVKVKKDQARSEKVKVKDEKDKVFYND